MNAPRTGALPLIPEEELWRGRFSAKAMVGAWCLWGLELVAVALIHFRVVGDAGSWVYMLYAAVLLAPLLWIVGATIVRKVTIRYRLSTHRLFKDRGFIRRRLDEVELIRVDDVSVSQNILERFVDVGRVTVISTDASEPRLEIEGIERPIEVKELIRKQVRKWRDRAIHLESI